MVENFASRDQCHLSSSMLKFSVSSFRLMNAIVPNSVPKINAGKWRCLRRIPITKMVLSRWKWFQINGKYFPFWSSSSSIWFIRCRNFSNGWSLRTNESSSSDPLSFRPWSKSKSISIPLSNPNQFSLHSLGTKTRTSWFRSERKRTKWTNIFCWNYSTR